MVHYEEGAKDESTEKWMKYKVYIKHRREQDAEDKKKTPWFRYFFPTQADWTVKENPYATHHRSEVFSTTNNLYPSKTNDFRDHLNY
jgi:hypothetical protein